MKLKAGDNYLWPVLRNGLGAIVEAKIDRLSPSGDYAYVGFPVRDWYATKKLNEAILEKLNDE